MFVNDIAITSLETITGFDITTGDLLFVLDELTDATIANTEDKQEITGKQGHKITNLKRNKGVTISGTNGMVSGGLMAVQTGGTFQNTTTQVMWADYLTVGASHTATTNFIAVGTAGAEIEELYIRNADGTLGQKFTQGNSAGSGVFTYNTSTKIITFNSAVEQGTEIVVYYKRSITASTLDNTADTYSKKCVLYVDALGEDKCSNVFRVQFYIPKADFTGQFDFEMGDNQTTHDFEAESLAGACVAGKRDLLWTYTIFGAESNDDALVVSTNSVVIAKGATSEDIAVNYANGALTAAVTDSSSAAYTKVKAVISGDNDSVIISADADAAVGTYTVTLTDAASKTVAIGVTVTA